MEFKTSISMSTTEDGPRTLLLGIISPRNRATNPQDYLEEFVNLVETLGVEYSKTWFTKLREIDKAHFLTKGKREELVKLCAEHQIGQIICSESLSPLQQRKLEDITECKVVDRMQLIIEIFKNAATSAEGRIQVEMAEIELLKTRLSGQGIEMSQQMGGIGEKGPGETYKEMVYRILKTRYAAAKKKLDVLQKSRDVQRKMRVESETPLVCLVGYTNAGKSSVLNAVTQSEVLVENKLFATLDTTTRTFFCDNRKILMADTVGFISELPHHLVAAFKSTLSELKYASVLLHIIDIHNPAWKDHIRVVNETLGDLEIDANTPVIHVFNKADLMTAEQLEYLEIDLLQYKPYVLCSTLSKEGIADVLELLANTLKVVAPAKKK